MEFRQNVWGPDSSWQTRDIARFCKQGLSGTRPQGFTPAGGAQSPRLRQPLEKACHFRFSKAAPRGSVTRTLSICPVFKV